MGKGDKKSRRGKLFSGSFGVRRPRKKKKVIAPVIKVAPVEVEEKKVKKTTRKKADSSKKEK